MALVVGLFSNQLSHFFAFIHEDAHIPFWGSQCQSTFQRGEGTRLVPLRLVSQRLQDQDFGRAANPSAFLGCLQKTLQ